LAGGKNLLTKDGDGVIFNFYIENAIVVTLRR